MKKIILAMAISFSFIALQSCTDEKKDNPDNEIPLSSVPAPVQSAFSTKYSTASDVKWEDAHEDTTQTYKAKFKIDGKKMKAEFDTNGSFVKEEEDN